MVIDIHTHAFPDELAPKGLETLMRNSKYRFHPASDMTVGGLLKNMDAWGIDLSVIQPVITKPSQFEGVNAWAKNIGSERILAFGGIYPHGNAWREQIDRLREMGFIGLKFHAEYQEFWLDDPKMMRIYEYAISRGFILLHHCGADPGKPAPWHTSPKRVAAVARDLGGGVLIAAHLGGHAQWEEVEEALAGTNVYLDTSMGFEYYSKEQFLRIVRAHGADKILFASDSPWSNAKSEIKTLRALPLTQSEKDAILGGNAQRILGL